MRKSRAPPVNWHVIEARLRRWYYVPAPLCSLTATIIGVPPGFDASVVGILNAFANTRGYIFIPG